MKSYRSINAGHSQECYAMLSEVFSGTDRILETLEAVVLVSQSWNLELGTWNLGAKHGPCIRHGGICRGDRLVQGSSESPFRTFTK